MGQEKTHIHCHRFGVCSYETNEDESVLEAVE